MPQVDSKLSAMCEVDFIVRWYQRCSAGLGMMVAHDREGTNRVRHGEIYGEGVNRRISV